MVKMSTTKQLANESELRFASEFVRAGWSVYLPYGEDSPVDLLIFNKEGYRRVQVKATKPKDGAIICKLRSTNNWQIKKYSLDEVDLFGLYDYENKMGYLIPFKDFAGMSQISFRLNKPNNNQVKGIRYAKQYDFF